MIRKINITKTLALVLTIIAVLSLFGSHIAGAQTQAPTGNPVGNCFTWTDGISIKCLVANAVNTLVTFMAFIGGMFIAVEVWFIDIILKINTNVVNQPLVQSGFSVTLAIANLGFVLGIIVIALATILRRETYGIKQMLWKLVFAAIFVNFSLVICGAIIGFSTMLTNYFMAPLSLSGGFASNIGAVFQPQQFFVPDGAITAPNPRDINSLFGGLGAALGDLVAPLITINTALIFIIAIVIVLGTLVIMLVVRYIYLAFLLILMPLAWVSWVFPSFKSHWNKWWSTFLRWTFFPPIVVFFLYLVILTGNTMNKTTTIGNTPIPPFASSSSDPVIAAISSFFGSLYTNILVTALNDTLLIGLAVGGLMVANSMSIKFADAGLKAVGKARDGVLGYVGRQGKKAVRATYRKAGGEALTKNLQEGNLGRLGRLPVLGGIARRGASIAGRGLANISDNESMVTEAAKKVPTDKKQWETEVKGSMRDELRMAYLKKGQQEGWVDEKTVVAGAGGKQVNVTEYLRDNRAKFHSYGQDGEGNLEEKLRDDTGITLAEVAAENEKLAKTVEAVVAKRDSAALKKELEFAENNSEPMSEEEVRMLKEFRATGKPGLSAEKEKRRRELKSLESFSGTGEGMSESEKQELANLEKDAEQGPGGLFLRGEEKENLKATQDKVAENNAKIKKLGSKNPEVVANAFQDDTTAREKLTKEGKPLPITLEPESVKRVQAAVLRAMAEGFSPQNTRSLIDAIGKKNNLKYFEGAMERIEREEPEKAALIKESAQTNKALRNWIENTPGNMLVDLNKMFGIKAKEESKEEKKKKEDQEA